MSWYKKAQSMDQFREKLFTSVINNVNGNWMPRKFKSWSTHISAQIDGTAANKVGNRTGYFDIRITIFLIHGAIKNIICSVYGMDFNNIFPDDIWMTKRLFNVGEQDMQDILEENIGSIEEIPIVVQKSIDKYFDEDEDNNGETQELEPNTPSGKRKEQYELV
jgi:hypothetical protein